MLEKKKLNIVYHFRVRGSGAEGVHIAGIINGFRGLGHTVHLVSPTNADPTVKSMQIEKSDRSVSVKTLILHKLADLLPQPFFELMEISYIFFAIMRLWKKLKSGAVDFIYERYAFFNFAGAFVSKRKNIPLIVEVNELSGHKRIRRQFFVRLCSAIEKYILRKASVVVTVSDFLNREVSNKVNLQKTKVITIPNGVPLAWLERKISLDKVAVLREKYGLEGKKIICFIGGLVHWHNFDLLLHAVKEVQESFSNVVMMFIGDGPLKDHIKESAKNLTLQSDSILFVGKVPHSDVPVYLKLADIAVIPETNDFRSPIKMFEYMAMGLPVIAPRKPTIEVAITHEKEGLLFETGNFSSMASMIMQCLSKPGFANELGVNAKQKVFKQDTWEKHAKHILLVSSHII